MRESSTRCERRQRGRKRQEGKEGVFRVTSDYAEIFWEGGGDWVDFVGSFLVCKDG